MALKMRKDIKKSSYYVWFLGAQESKGLRGSEYVLPVVKSLIQRERTVEPFKVTLQVSHKGLKIIQNVPQNPQAPKSKKPEVVKHFIPHHAVTCVIQDVDIVSCILLLYNPVTKCPVHVHAYRCDSVETAEILKGQLQTLIERPDNQKKLGEIEARLRAKGLLPPAQHSRPPPARRLNSGGGSDGRSTSTRESESSGGSSSERLSGVGNQERITSLYDSLAAELREKLGGGLGKRAADPPILLPPRDYDTVHRQKGNLAAIDLRRCLNTNIVGVNVKKEANGKKGALGSSGGSSGIGSDHAPSPDQVDPDQRYLDNQSTSDEEWTEQPSEDSLFLVQPGAGWPRTDLSLPRARRVPSNEPAPPTPSPPSPPRRPRQRSPSPPPPKRPLQPKSRAITNNTTISKLSPRDRFKDAKEKFLMLERERLEEQERAVFKSCEQTKKRGSLHELPISPVSRPSKPPAGWGRSRDSEEEAEDEVFERGYPRREVDERVKGRGRKMEQYSPPSDSRGYDRVRRYSGEYAPEPQPRKNTEFSPEGRSRHSEGYSPDRKLRNPEMDRKQRHPEFSPERKPRHPEFSPERKQRHPEYSPERNKRQPEFSPERNKRQPEFSPERNKRHPEFSPERNKRHPEFSPERNKRHPEFSPERKQRHPEFSPDPKQRHPEFSPERKPRRGSEDFSPDRRQGEYGHPRAAVRRDYAGEGRYRGDAAAKYRSPDREDIQAQDKKRRSMFDVLEEERRRSSNELAKEFKRRSFQDAPSEHSRSSNLEERRVDPRQQGRGHGSYQELSDNDRFPGLDRETARHVAQRNMVSSVPDGRYRHSYAEPGLSHCLSLSQPHHDLLHRTNSTLSSGRVGIAAVHPY